MTRAQEPQGGHSEGEVEVRDAVEAYLDGALPAGERARFEEVMARDAAVREQVRLARMIRESLARLFEPAAGALALPMEPLVPAESAAAADGKRGGGWRRWKWAAAAVLVLGFGSMWVAGVIDPPAWVMPVDKDLYSPAGAYELQKRRGFEPAWECETGEVFENSVRAQFGQGLLARSASGVELRGWTYDGAVLSRDSWTLLARVDGEDVIVIVDRKRRDRRVGVDPGTGLRLYRAVRGDLVVYEVTPREGEGVLPLLYVPEKDCK